MSKKCELEALKGVGTQFKADQFKGVVEEVALINADPNLSPAQKIKKIQEKNT